MSNSVYSQRYKLSHFSEKLAVFLWYLKKYSVFSIDNVL